MPRRGTELREHVIVVATELFYRDGFRVTSMDAVADEATITKRSLYHHFSTKEDLIAEVLRRRHAIWITTLRSELAKRADNPLGQIVAWFDVLAESIRSPKYMGCIFFKASVEFPDPPAVIREVIRENTETGDRLLLRLATESRAKKPTELAQELGVLRRGAQMSAIVSRNPLSGLHARSAALRLLAHHGLCLPVESEAEAFSARRIGLIHA
jgi:AcrR family transcriptional regulator